MNKTIFISLFFLIFLSTAAHAQPNIIPNQYIVILSETADSRATARAAATAHNGTVKHVYEDAINGFTITLPAKAVAGLERNPHVVAIVPDQRVERLQRPCRPSRPCTPTPDHTATPSVPPTNTPIPTATATSAGTGSQSIPNNILRVNGDSSPTRSGDGTGVVEVDIAVIDTGIDVDHPDLNVVGGYNCHTGGSEAADYDDNMGHGTHVAGIIGARDNTFGVVGVAPGARLWSIRIFDEDGLADVSDIVCGLDWVYQNRDVIDVVNISAGGGGSDSSCNNRFDPLHQVVCAVYAAGIPIVVAAGNTSENANNFVPATFDEVIAVSNLVDSDGGPGGVGSDVCNEADDTYSAINNYGSDIDMIAPGTCITSTWLGGAYATVSGTSAAAPHVAGALAVYLHSNPAATGDEMIAAVFAQSTLDWDATNDADGVQEPLLNVGNAQNVTPTPTPTSVSDMVSTPTTTPTPIPTQPPLPTTTPFPTETITPTVIATSIPTIPPTNPPTPTSEPPPLSVGTAVMHTETAMSYLLIFILLGIIAITSYVFLIVPTHTD